MLDRPEAVLDLDVEALGAGRRTDASAAWTDPLLAVCTHGKRDACCAERGRPLARALGAAPRPEHVWETSHLGGHRFAATFIALPAGLVYGRVPAALGPAIADGADRGEIVLEHLRGRAGLSAHAQVADAHVRLREGLTGLDDVGVVVEVADLGDGRLEVGVRLRDGRERRVAGPPGAHRAPRARCRAARTRRTRGTSADRPRAGRGRRERARGRRVSAPGRLESRPCWRRRGSRLRGPGSTVLRDVDLTAPAGDVTALLGAVGGGEVEPAALPGAARRAGGRARRRSAGTTRASSTRASCAAGSGSSGQPPVMLPGDVRSNLAYALAEPREDALGSRR